MSLLKGCSDAEVASIVPNYTVLLGYRGSIAHNMYVPSTDPTSIDDKDIMGVFIPPLDHYFGLSKKEHHEVFLREWDAVSYEIRKFVSLLEKANPNVLSLLWLEPKHYILKTAIGEELIARRDMFVSKAIYHSFTGYAYGQLHKMTATTFRGYMGEKRKQLVEKFGYDTKNAAHLIRLLRMGIEFLNEGVLHVAREDAAQLLEIKRGEWSLERVKTEAEGLFKRAQETYDRCKLPAQVEHEKVNALVTDLVAQHFGNDWRRE